MPRRTPQQPRKRTPAKARRRHFDLKVKGLRVTDWDVRSLVHKTDELPQTRKGQ